MAVFACLAVFALSQAAPSDLNDLSMEVAALQSLRQFDLDAVQLEALARLGRPVGDSRKREAARAAPALRKTMSDLRAALARKDDDRIEALAEKLSAAYEKAEPDLDDEVSIAEAARKRVGDALRLLKPRQAATFFAQFSDDWKGPARRLREAANTSRNLVGDGWKEARDAAAEDAAWLLAGASDPAAWEAARKRAMAFLDKARKMTEKDWKADRDEAERLESRLLAGAGPVQLLQNALERELAELLSNPRLPAAAELLLSARKKK